MGCDESSDHGDFGSPFQLKFSSHAADILGANGDGGMEGGCGRGGGEGLRAGGGEGGLGGGGWWSIAGRRGGMLLYWFSLTVNR